MSISSNRREDIVQSRNDESDTTPGDPASEPKKVKSGTRTTAMVIGVIVGIAVWSATHRKPFLTFVLLAAAIVIGRRAAAK